MFYVEKDQHISPRTLLPFSVKGWVDISFLQQRKLPPGTVDSSRLKECVTITGGAGHRCQDREQWLAFASCTSPTVVTYGTSAPRELPCIAAAPLCHPAV